MKQLLLIVYLLLFLLPARAQVVFDFEDGNITQWYSEGDGDFELNPTQGLPGQCLQVNDDATGDWVILIAPYEFTGDWTAATVNDSIAYELKPISSDPDLITDAYFLVQLSGPGGTATAWSDFVPVMNAWQHIAIPIDPAVWTLTEGTWSALMAEVALVRIRTEFITGDEYSLVDNVKLTFSPEHNQLDERVCSTFDETELLDGWGFDDVASVVVDTTDGQPANCLRIGDASGDLSIGIAPPKFRGNWTAVNGTGTIEVDVKVSSSSTTLSSRPYLVRIAGTGGSATANITDAEVQAALGQWTTWSIPIQEASWSLESGSWAGLMTGVAEVKLQLEFINGTETVYFDNFCIGNAGTTGVEVLRQEGIHLWPNPAGDRIELGGMNGAYTVWGPNGAAVLSGVMAYGKPTTLPLYGLAPGIYTLRVTGAQATTMGRFVKQ